MTFHPSFILTTVIVFCLFVDQTDAQRITCDLRPLNSDSLLGECTSDDWSRPAMLEKSNDPVDLIWSGGIHFENYTLPLAIGTYSYGDGPKLIAQTFAWFPLDVYRYSSSGLMLSWDSQQEAPPSQTDLEILQAASELISSVDIWDREDDRNCENDGQDISVYCALARSTAQFMGRYRHRQPAMQVVRLVIQDKWNDRITSHRLMDFNNHPSTTLDDVQELFSIALERLRPAIK